MKKGLILLFLFLGACSSAKTRDKFSHQVVTVYADKVSQTIEEYYQKGYYLNEHIDLGNRGMMYILCFEQ